MDVATTTVGLTDLKFRLVREDFADAVAWVARNLPTRPTVPVLAGVLLTGSDDGLTISGFDYEVSARTVDAHVVNLRRKIEADPAAPRYVQTVYGRGYRMADQ